MKVPLPNLDDRRWADLVDEGRSLIPVYAPDWTDHNAHDPGITLIELFAWIAEMDVYQLNRISDEEKLKFLALVGITPEPPQTAHTVLSPSLKGAVSRRFDRGAQFGCKDSFGEPILFRLTHPVTAMPGQLAAVQFKDAKGFHDLTPRLRRGEPLGLFGDVPVIGTELYLGFTLQPVLNEPLNLYFGFTGSRSGFDERRRLLEEKKSLLSGCRHAADCDKEDCRNKNRHGDHDHYHHHDHDHHDREAQGPHQSLSLNRVRLTWEFAAKVNDKLVWKPFDGKLKQVRDFTRSFTLDGRVLIQVPAEMISQSLGHVAPALYYIRCRFEAGAYDAPPTASNIVMNAALAEQSAPVTETLPIKSGVTATGTAPNPGDIQAIEIDLDQTGFITSLEFKAPTNESPGFQIIEYKPATNTASGRLIIRAAWLGYANGRPHQQAALPIAEVQQKSLRLYSEEKGRWRAWTRVNDFIRSTRRDARFELDAAEATIIFSDGEHGRVPPEGAKLFAVYRATRAEHGNIAAGADFNLSDSLLNRIIVPDFDAVSADITGITNAVEATGGTPAETLDHAIGRAVELMDSNWRAVTLRDCEELAIKTPGARIARATARPALHPGFPCFDAPGLITLIVLPDMPSARPMPGVGLLHDVEAYLRPREIIGTRVEVVGPRYLEVTVAAAVKVLDKASKTAVQRDVIAALNRFFNPLNGGPDGTGWPFGRDVYRSEVLQVIDEVPGVDYIISLELFADGCGPQCGNVYLGPTWLVAAGDHEITVS